MAEQTAPSGEYFFSKFKAMAAFGALTLLATSCGVERDASGDMVPSETVKCNEISEDRPKSIAAGDDPWKGTVIKENGTQVTFYVKETATGVSYSPTIEGNYTEYKEGKVILDTEGLKLVASRGLIGSSVRVIC